MRNRTAFHNFHLLLYLLFILFTLPYPINAATVRIVAYEYPPYAESELPGNGPTVEMAVRAFSLAGHTPTFQFLPWKRCLAVMQSGEADVLLNMYFSSERVKDYTYPMSHSLISGYTFFALKSRLDIPEKITMEELFKLRVGIIEGASYGRKFDSIKSMMPNAITGVLRERQLLLMMLYDRVDLVPSDKVSGWHFLRSHTDKAHLVRSISSPFFERKKLYPVFSKNSPNHKEFALAWDRSIAAMEADGSLHILLEKHGIPPETR